MLEIPRWMEKGFAELGISKVYLQSFHSKFLQNMVDGPLQIPDSSDANLFFAICMFGKSLIPRSSSLRLCLAVSFPLDLAMEVP